MCPHKDKYQAVQNETSHRSGDYDKVALALVVIPGSGSKAQIKEKNPTTVTINSIENDEPETKANMPMVPTIKRTIPI